MSRRPRGVRSVDAVDRGVVETVLGVIARGVVALDVVALGVVVGRVITLNVINLSVVLRRVIPVVCCPEVDNIYSIL